jgi:hypothetical protein
MANVYAVTNGNWSNTAIWNTGSLPATIDDVYANNFTVYVDGNYKVSLVTNLSSIGITAGGRFILNNGVALSANVIGGGANQVACVQFLSASPSFCTLVGDLCAVNTTISGPRALLNNSSGTFTVYGNGLGRIKSVAGNPADGYIQNQSTGTLNLFGNYIAGVNVNAVVDNRGIWNQGGGTINLVGQLSGANNAGSQGLYNQTGTINITGNIIANFGGGLQSNAGVVNIIGNVFSTNSTGLNNQTTSTINLQGNIITGNGEGARNASNTNPINVIGNIIGGTASAATGINNTGTNTVNVTGNSTAGITTNCHGIQNASTGVVNLFGNAYGGPSGGGAAGVNQSAGGVCNIIGDVYSGVGSSGINNTSSSTGTINLTGNVYADLSLAASNSNIGTVNINGSVYGGRAANAYGIQNSTTGTVLISGFAVGGIGSAAYGAFNNSTGILRVKRAVGNGWGLGYTTAVASTPGVFSNVAGSRTFVEELECGPRGQWPTGGVIFFTPNSKATSMFETDTFQNYSLIQSNSADNLLPPVSSVRQGTVYDLGTDTGTCIIPPASSVALNVPVDNTTGTATLVSTNVWNISSQEITDNQSIGGRLKNTLTANAAEKLVNSFNLN